MADLFFSNMCAVFRFPFYYTKNAGEGIFLHCKINYTLKFAFIYNATKLILAYLF